MTDVRPPVARREPVEVEHHGIRVTDPYAWLRDDRWQEVMRDPSVLRDDIRVHLEAENAWTDATLAPHADLQATLFDEMKGRIAEDDDTVPVVDGPWAYFTRFVTGGEYPVLCRTPRDGGDVEVLYDGNVEGEGEAFFQIGALAYSPDHGLLAHATDRTGSEYHTLRIRDLATGEDLPDVEVEDVAGVVWAPDNTTFFTVRLDEHHRPSTVRRHRLDRDAVDVVFHTDDTGVFVHIGTTQDDSLLLIEVADHQTSEVRLLPLDDPTAEPRLIAPAEQGVEYHVDRHGDDLVIRTNADGARDFAIVTAPLATPGRDHWTPVVNHVDGHLVAHHGVLADHLVRLETVDALPRIVVRDLRTGDETVLAFDEEAYALGMDLGAEYATTMLRFTYESPTTPTQTWDVDLATGDRTLRKTQDVPSGHDPSDYVVRRLHAPAPDGELVPVTVLHRADAVLDGSAPCHLYGYGSYGLSMSAKFSTTVLSLVDRGFVHAVAHVRGGRERGMRWYDEGKREHKPNTFTDFLAAAELLVAEGFTSAGRIAAHGGSAGGLLVGAAMNLRPDLFGAVVGQVPFVDVLTTMLDDTLPLTPPEWPEWGNPALDADAFRTIASYSPYDNVSAAAYPHVLATAGLADPRVTYWEPAKWVAKLRHERTDDSRMLLLRTEMEAGHGGKSGRFRRLEETAEAYTFILAALDATA